MPALSRAIIVETARSYVGVPFRPFGRSREYGVDCPGLLICVCRDLHRAGYEIGLPGFSEAWEIDAPYSMRPPKDALLAVVNRIGLVPIGKKDIAPGDIAIMAQAWNHHEPGHFGFLAQGRVGLSMIHAHAAQTTKHRPGTPRSRGAVVEQPLGRWIELVLYFRRIPGLRD